MLLRAKLLFDTAATGAMVGTRGLAQAERSLLFATDAIAVDMMAFESGGGVHVVHGQIIDRATERPVVGARVVLGPAGEAVETDHFGEFSLSTLDPIDEQVLRVTTSDLHLHCAVPGVPRREGTRS